MFQKLANHFQNSESIEIKLDTNIGKYSWIKLQNIGHLAVISSVDALIAFKKYCNENSLNYLMLGMGANQVLTKSDIIYLKLEFKFKESYLDKVRDVYTLPSSISLNKLTSHAIKNGLKGWEVFTGIPAQLGGAIAMNAGTRLGEIGDLIESFDLIDKDGNKKTIKVDEHTFTYRKCLVLNDGDTIISAKIRHFGIDSEIGNIIKDYLRKRNETQPLSEKTCGCVFKNPTPTLPAGMLIEASGIKGLDNSGVKISEKHGNFFENHSDADISDFLELKDIATEYVDLNFGQKFELEVKI